LKGQLKSWFNGSVQLAMRGTHLACKPLFAKAQEARAHEFSSLFTHPRRPDLLLTLRAGGL
jgi:hypothetical protein